MSQRHRERNIIHRSLKYSLFFLGLLVIIGGELGAQQLKLPLNAEIAIAVAGFVVFLLGIVLE
jgi:hypothetical protein